MKKTILFELKLLCDDIYEQSKGKIVNGLISEADAHQLSASIEKLHADSESMISRLCKFMISHILFALVLLYQVSKEKSDIKYIHLLILFCLLDVVIAKMGDETLYYPGQEFFLKCFLNEKDFQQHILFIRFDRATKQFFNCDLNSNRRLLSNFGFFNKELDEHLRYHRVNPYVYEMLMKAIFAIQNQSYDCVSLAGIVLLKMLENKMDVVVERFTSKENNQLSHCFLVVSAPNQGITGKKSIIIDPWYHVCVEHAETNQPNFYERYPLLTFEDKEISMRINPKSAYESHEFFVKHYKQLVAHKTNELPGVFDTIFPKLSRI